jgi:AraC-like DNA-binding protein
MQGSIDRSGHAYLHFETLQADAAMPHLIRSASLTDYLEVAHSTGLDAYRMVNAVGLPKGCLRDPDVKIPLAAVARLLETSARAAGIDNFGLRLSEKRLLSNLGPVGLIAREQPTGRAAVQVIARYIGLHSDGISVRVQEDANLVVIIPVISIGRSVPIRQTVELSVGVTFRTLRILLGTSWNPQVISFVHGPPKSLEMHRRVFGSRVKFAQQFNGVVCRARDLDKPLPASDPVMARYIHQYLDMIAARPNVTTTDKVREFVRTLLPTGRCSIEHVAERLGIDRRTVHRQLAQERTTFSSLVEDVRAEMVGHYLQDPSRPLYLIAQMLGFTALSVFSRWFKARYGCSASQWRTRELKI